MPRRHIRSPHTKKKRRRSSSKPSSSKSKSNTNINTNTSTSTSESKPFPRANPDSRDLSLSSRSRSSILSQSILRESSSVTRTHPKPEYKRWPRQDPPITNINDIPKSWNWSPDELDLATDDIDAQITRNRERIKDGILPRLFEIRLREYEKKKTYRDQIISSEPKGLSMNIITRLASLKDMKGILEKNGDENEQLSNVNGLIKAYRKRKLTWSNEGKVTYWYKGMQLCEPRHFKLEELIELNRKYNPENKHNEGKGFWVEGFSGPEPRRMMLSITIPENLAVNLWPTHMIWIEVRIPGTLIGLNFEFLEDTGANAMSIFNSDLESLIIGTGQPGLLPINLGDIVYHTANSTETDRSVLLEARVAHGGIFTKWYLLETVIRRDPPVDSAMNWRLSGSWWRETLYTASFPDSRRVIALSDNYWHFVKAVPDVNPIDVVPVSPPMAGQYAGNVGFWNQVYSQLPSSGP